MPIPVAKFMFRLLNEAPVRAAIEKFCRMAISDAWALNGEDCMSINQAIELTPSDAEVGTPVRGNLLIMEMLFVKTIGRGHRDGSVDVSMRPLGPYKSNLKTLEQRQMKISHICSATLIVGQAGKKFLVDPMLAPKDTYLGFPALAE